MVMTPSAVRRGSMVLLCEQVFFSSATRHFPSSPRVGVVGVDVGMGSTRHGRQEKPTTALPGATSLSSRWWR
jgi:hypothetical protein